MDAARPVLHSHQFSPELAGAVGSSALEHATHPQHSGNAARRLVNDRSLVRRTGAADPLRPVADFVANERSTRKLDLRSRHRESQRRQQRSFAAGRPPAAKRSGMNDCIRSQRTHPSDPYAHDPAMHRWRGADGAAAVPARLTPSPSSVT